MLQTRSQYHHCSHDLPPPSSAHLPPLDVHFSPDWIFALPPLFWESLHCQKWVTLIFGCPVTSVGIFFKKRKGGEKELLLLPPKPNCFTRHAILKQGGNSSMQSTFGHGKLTYLCCKFGKYSMGTDTQQNYPVMAKCSSWGKMLPKLNNDTAHQQRLFVVVIIVIISSTGSST